MPLNCALDVIIQIVRSQMVFYHISTGGPTGPKFEF